MSHSTQLVVFILFLSFDFRILTEVTERKDRGQIKGFDDEVSAGDFIAVRIRLLHTIYCTYQVRSDDEPFFVAQVDAVVEEKVEDKDFEKFRVTWLDDGPISFLHSVLRNCTLRGKESPSIYRGKDSYSVGGSDEITRLRIITYCCLIYKFVKRDDSLHNQSAIHER